MADAQKELKEDRMLVRKIVHTLCGVVLLGVLATSSTGAMTFHRTTYFTFSGAVAMPRVANPDGGSNVVRVLSRDRKKTYLMGLTRGVDRPRGNLDATITLGETAPGAPPKVKAWFPESETHGREFIY